MHAHSLILFFASYRWASLLWATVTSYPSPISAAVWHLAASLSASSSTACPFPFCLTGFQTTTPNWRNRSTAFQTRNAPSRSRNAWGANTTAAANLSQRTQMTRYIIGLVWGNLSTRGRTEENCLITCGARKCKTSSASSSEPIQEAEL